MTTRLWDPFDALWWNIRWPKDLDSYRLLHCSMVVVRGVIFLIWRSNGGEDRRYMVKSGDCSGYWWITSEWLIQGWCFGARENVGRFSWGYAWIELKLIQIRFHESMMVLWRFDCFCWRSLPKQTPLLLADGAFAILGPRQSQTLVMIGMREEWVLKCSNKDLFFLF